MDGWLLDSNVVIELLKSHPNKSVIDWARGQPGSRQYISSLVIGEYIKGIEALPPDDARRPRFRDWLALAEREFEGRILPISDDVARRWGELSGQHMRQDQARRPPPAIDTLMLATAMVHNLVFVTRNSRDVLWAGWPVFDPWLDDPRRFAMA